MSTMGHFAETSESICLTYTKLNKTNELNWNKMLLVSDEVS